MDGDYRKKRTRSWRAWLAAGAATALAVAAFALVVTVVPTTLQPASPSSGISNIAASVAMQVADRGFDTHDASATDPTSSRKSNSTPTVFKETPTTNKVNVAREVVSGGGADGNAPEYEAGVVLVQAAEGVSVDDLERALTQVEVADTGASAVAVDSKGLYEISLVEGADELEAVNAIGQLDEVGYSQPNYFYPLSEEPDANLASLSPAFTNPDGSSLDSLAANDPLVSQEWYLNSVRAFGAWQALDVANVQDNEPVTVAVFDTGLQIDHEDLQSAVATTYDATGKLGQQFHDIHGHGTHVAGIIAAEVGNELGIAGVGGNWLKVLPIAVHETVGNSFGAYSSTLARAYDYVSDNAERYNIRVANLSLGALMHNGLESDDRAVIDSASVATSKGVLSVASAGNENSTVPHFPGDYYGTGFSIIALDEDETRASYSNYNAPGEQVKRLSAPGSNLISTISGSPSSYSYMSGTSMASPVAAAVAGLVFTADPSLTPEQTMELMIDTARDVADLGFDDETGAGIVDAFAAVLEASDVHMDLTDISRAAVSNVEDKHYRGGWALTQDPTVMLGDQKLVEYRDYYLTYENNTQVGTATMNVVGMGAYSGSMSKTFEITKTDLRSNYLSFYVEESTSMVYDGSAIRPDIWLSDDGFGGRVEPGTDFKGDVWQDFFGGGSTSDANEGMPFVEGEDFKLTCSNNKNAGTATAKITGLGGFSGTVTKTFKIAPAIMDEAVYCDSYIEKVYTGSEICPSPVMRMWSNDKKLKKGVDYMLTYANNVDVGEASIIVKSMTPNILGSTVAHFDITPRSIKKASIAPLGTFAETGNPIEPKPVVVLNDKTLVEDVDYELRYGDNVATGTAWVEIQGINNYMDDRTVSFKIIPNGFKAAKVADIEDQVYTGEPLEPVPTVMLGDVELEAGTDFKLSYADNVDVGYATVSIEGIGSYKGSIDKQFKIVRAPIANATVTGIVDMGYTGSAITQGIVVSLGDRVLVEGDDYKITYRNNKNVGIATVTITGLGNYAGSIVRTFAISNDSLTNALVYDVVDKRYTGRQIVQAPTVVVAGRTLVKDTDYTLEYRDNVNAGMATLTITGIGDYTGSQEVHFQILKAANTMRVKSASRSVNVSRLKYADAYFPSAVTVVNPQGHVEFYCYGVPGIQVDCNTGELRVKKGLPRGTYRAHVEVFAAGTSNHEPAWATAVVTVRVTR